VGGKAIDPKEAKEVMIAAGVTPLVPFEERRTPWRSRCNTCRRIVTPSYGNVVNGHGACTYCARGGITEAEAQKLLKQLNAKPLESYPGSKKPWLCKCLTCQREITPTINNIRRTHNVCIYCSRRKVDPDEASELALKAGAKPLEPYPNAGPWKCKCLTCSRIIYPTIRRIRNGQNPCGWCAGVRTDPNDAKQEFLGVGLKPIGKFPGVNVRWRAICTKCGEKVERSLAHIRQGRYVCAFCNGRKVNATKARDIAVKAGAIPLEPFEGVYEKWKCKCLVCLREITPTFGSIRDGHNPCPYCAGKKVDGVTAKKFAISRGLSPNREFPGATKKWKMTCLKCERVYLTTWTSLQTKRKNAGCSSCTEFGFKPLEPSYLYLITHSTKKAHKVGIGNTNSKRIEKHIKNGWDIFAVWKFEKGADAHRIEQVTIDWLRNDKSIGPAFRVGDGWTETVPSDSISLRALRARVLLHIDGQGVSLKKADLNQFK